MSGIFGAIANAGGVAKSGWIALRCGSQQWLRVTVTDPVTNAVVQGAKVTATGAGGWSRRGWTDVNGVKEFIVEPGTYSVTAAKDWFLPEPASVNNIAVAAGATVAVPLNIEELRFYLEVDADRDGIVENQWTDDPQWTWGQVGSGAIVLCNCDDDAAANAADNADNVVNANDANDIAPLTIERIGSAQTPPNTWTAQLSVDPGDEAYLRIFDGRAAGAAEIIPSNGAQANVYDIALHAGGGGAGFQTALMGMEARQYPDGDFPGRVTIWLTVTKPGLEGGNASYSTGAKVHVAPWMMPSHLDEVHTVYVSDLGADGFDVNGVQNQGNAGFRAAFAAEVANAVPQPPPPTAPAAGHRWMQDVMEIGWSTLPANPRPHRIDVVLEAKGNYGLQNFIRGLRGADFGHIKVDSGVGNDHAFDGLGNLEVTPPVRSSGGDEYPWGRMLFGPGWGNDAMDRKTRAFLHAQVVQRPIEIDTTWLTIGHVDEILCFLPRPAGPQWKQWFVLVPSPRRAYELLAQAPPLSTIMHGRWLYLEQHDRPKAFEQAQQTVANFLRGTTLITDPTLAARGEPGRIGGPALETWNVGLVQARLDAVVDVLRDAIGLTDTDIVEVPVVFFPTQPAWDPVTGDAADLPDHCAGFATADMVNMTLVNDRCIVPAPFGARDPGGVDRFEQDLTANIQAKNANLNVAYVDNWYPYHILEGEIHCGTNVRRHPGANLNAWLDSADARWWEYIPPL
ncbi:MAG TPA: protein-arginine deiminase family protein [Thermoanaerobaculia bacterium]|jgi:protein-arginine deiminase